jgi:hypothetical protein
LWHWDKQMSRTVDVIDDFERLPKTTDGWKKAQV